MRARTFTNCRSTPYMQSYLCTVKGTSAVYGNRRTRRVPRGFPLSNRKSLSSRSLPLKEFLIFTVQSEVPRALRRLHHVPFGANRCSRKASDSCAIGSILTTPNFTAHSIPFYVWKTLIPSPVQQISNLSNNNKSRNIKLKLTSFAIRSPIDSNSVKSLASFPFPLKRIHSLGTFLRHVTV